MKVILKSKITKKGHLCICVTDAVFPENNSIIEIDTENDVFSKKQIKPRIYIKIDNIETKLEKDNYVSLKYKKRIIDKIEKAKTILEDNGIFIKESISNIQYKNNTPLLESQNKRDSCKGSWLNFFSL